MVSDPLTYSSGLANDCSSLTKPRKSQTLVRLSWLGSRTLQSLQKQSRYPRTSQHQKAMSRWRNPSQTNILQLRLRQMEVKICTATPMGGKLIMMWRMTRIVGAPCHDHLQQISGDGAFYSPSSHRSNSVVRVILATKKWLKSKAVVCYFSCIIMGRSYYALAMHMGIMELTSPVCADWRHADRLELWKNTV